MSQEFRTGEQLNKSRPRLIFLSGGRHQGKTSLLTQLIEQTDQLDLTSAGILCPGLWQAGRRSGFDLLELDTRRRSLLSRRVSGLKPIPFLFNAEALEQGRQALSPARCRNADLVVLDEVGPVELEGEGWAGCLPGLLSLVRPLQIWVVRRSALAAVQDRFQVQPVIIDCADPLSLKRLLDTFPGNR